VFAWQEGYSAFSVSPANKRAVIDYISQQEDHHRKRSFEQELRAILRKLNIAYDPNFVFG